MLAVSHSNLSKSGEVTLTETAELVKAGILPSPEEAKKAYYALGDDWWKQIIDGRFHKHGSKVFDEGLHCGPRERGYLAGIEAASQYFVDNMHRPLTLALYRETHRKAISHFESRGRNGAGCSWEEIDRFRDNLVSCSGYPIGIGGFLEVEKDRVALQEARRIILNRKPGVSLENERTVIQKQWKAIVVKAFGILPNNEGKSDEELTQLLLSTYAELTKSQKVIAMAEMEKMNLHFVQIARRLGLAKPFAECSINDSIDFAMTTWYLVQDPFLHALICEKLFEEFNQNLANARKEAYEKLMSNQKVEEIKSSYQERAMRLIA